jgi:hypothetical protein
MTDRPIIFSAAMVRALLDGRKTQTRRVIKPQPRTWEARVIDITTPLYSYDEACWGQVETTWNQCSAMWEPEDEIWRPLNLRHAIGDRLWVKEGFTVQQCNRYTSMDGHHLHTCIDYAADGRRDWIKMIEGDAPKILKRVKDRKDGARAMAPAIFLPKQASRLTLFIEDVRVERLNDCSEADALAEGVVFDSLERGFMVPGVEHPCKDFRYLSRATARDMYAALWDVINGSGAWLANPWIVALTFRVVRENIDRIAA